MAVCKVPANDMEALKSSLMGLFEKKRVIGLYKFINGCNFEDKNTWNKMDITKLPMKDCFAKFGVEENTIDFMGHAIAL
jgi:Rab GDP dissociation inhibitor